MVFHGVDVAKQFFSTPPMTAGTRLIVPHMVTGNQCGGNYVTKLTLVNFSAGQNNVTVQYFNQQGTPTNPFNRRWALLTPSATWICEATKKTAVTSAIRGISSSRTRHAPTSASRIANK